MDDQIYEGHYKDHILNMPTSPGLLQRIRLRYIDEVIKNIKSRFPDSDFIVSFSALAMRPLSFVPADQLDTWGNDKIQNLVDYYGKEKKHKYKLPGSKVFKFSTSKAKLDSDETMTEWMSLKKVVLMEQYPRDSLQILWKCIAKCHPNEYPNMTLLACLALTHPVHTSDCERSFSVQNIITTAKRNRLSNDHIDQHMRIIIQGPPVCDHNFMQALKIWREKKYRYVLKE